ncbi:type II toxin-antitoxin system death-on-curing family toxin [Allopusillimonas ginsengisoli]|nr:type II toxin-antitoxin system death-on-curing family toxin [Allopusillimonas ginsengisoli]
MLDVDYVITIHDEIIAQFGGLSGYGQGGRDAIESALSRIEHHAYYADVDDVFAIAALYAVAIARGHVFNDGNKRTGLTCALTYLLQQDIFIPEVNQLEDIMVDVASGEIEHEVLADLFSALWIAHDKRVAPK